MTYQASSLEKAADNRTVDAFSNATDSDATTITDRSSGIFTLADELNEIKDINHLLRRGLRQALKLSDCDAGAVYRVMDGRHVKCLTYRIRSQRLDLFRDGDIEAALPITPLTDPLYHMPNHINLAAHVVNSQKSVQVDNLSQRHGYDLSDLRYLDQQNGYQSKALYILPLYASDGSVAAVMSFINPLDGTGDHDVFDQQRLSYIKQLSSFVQVVLQNRLLEKEQRRFTDSVIQVLAKAIDQKSPHTGNHCQRVPVVNEMLAEAACAQRDGHFAEFSLSDAQKYELRVAAWLHDCGKIAVPDHLMSKSSRLETVRDGIEEIATRLEVVKRDIELDTYKAILEDMGTAEDLMEERDQALAKLDYHLAYLRSLNHAEQIDDPELQENLETIASLTWIDWSGKERSVLSSKEIEALGVRHGTLTASERKAIEAHAAYGSEMLKNLAFPKSMRNVHDIAAAHHERLDGTGYPLGLKGDEIPMAARILAIADIFEALTAPDRPYKRQKSLSEALNIMAEMRDDGHIDANLFDLFLTSRVWLNYAIGYLPFEAVDDVEINSYRRPMDLARDVAGDLAEHLDGTIQPDLQAADAA